MFIKQIFNINELAEAKNSESRVLLLETEKNLRDLYALKFLENGLQVTSYGSWHNIFEFFLSQKADLLVISFKPADNFEIILNNLKKILSEAPELPVMTIGETIPLPVLSQIMGLGVRSHLEKKFTRPLDLVLVARTILTQTN